MTPAEAAEALPGSDWTCPYLGLADDPATHFAYPSSAQRCHATDRPSTIDLAKQAQDCLTAQHLTCPRYRPLADPAPAGGLLREAVERPDLAPARPGRAFRRGSAANGGSTARPRSRPRRTTELALFAVLLVAVGVGGLMLGSRLAAQMGNGAPGASGSAGGASAASPSVSAAPAATPTPLATPTPVATPTAAAPSGTPAETGSPTPTPPQTPAVHVVKPGETLSQIALRYGVTVDALQTANKITDPNVLLAGQRLVIPNP